MIDLTTATKDELFFLFFGLTELQYADWKPHEVEIIKQLKMQFRDEFSKRRDKQE